MFFTREDILKIQQALLQLGVKDSELPSAEPVTYDDTLSIVQEGKNKQIGVKDFFNQISLWKREDFLNITDRYDEHYIMLLEAINLIPTLQRKDGLVITFQDTNGDWRIYQFRGNITEFLNEDKWFDLYDYKNYIIKSFLPDEEDITALTPDENGNSLLALKDRIYDPTIFNGKGYKFVRKNIINVELATIKISVINPTVFSGTVYFKINNIGTNINLTSNLHNTNQKVAEAIKDALAIAYTDYEVTVANSIVTLTRKYSGKISPTTFEMYNTGVKVIVEDSTIIEERNIITQEDISEENTIYEIRYDFDLDGKTLTIPNNCVLYFTSGKFYNGSINMDNTIVSTLYEDVLSEVNINGNYYNIQKHIKDHQSQLDDKQQQITANDEDISLLQTRSTQMEDAIKGISASGGASQASAVTYENTESGLDSITAQGAIDELANKKFNKENIAQESGEAEDKVMSQKAVTNEICDISSRLSKLEADNKLAFCINTSTQKGLTINLKKNTYSVDFSFIVFSAGGIKNCINVTDQAIIGIESNNIFRGTWFALVNKETSELKVYTYSSIPEDITKFYFVATGIVEEKEVNNNVTFTTSKISLINDSLNKVEYINKEFKGTLSVDDNDLYSKIKLNNLIVGQHYKFIIKADKAYNFVRSDKGTEVLAKVKEQDSVFEYDFLADSETALFGFYPLEGTLNYEIYAGTCADVASLRSIVNKQSEKISNILYDEIKLSNKGYVNSDGIIIQTQNAQYSNYICIKNYKLLTYYNYISSASCAVSFFDKNKKFIDNLKILGDVNTDIKPKLVDLTNEKYSNAYYVIVSNYGDKVEPYAKLFNPYNLSDTVETLVNTTDAISYVDLFANIGYVNLEGLIVSSEKAGYSNLISTMYVSEIRLRTNIGTGAAAISFYDINNDIIPELTIDGAYIYKEFVLDLTEEKYKQAVSFRVSCYGISNYIKQAYCKVVYGKNNDFYKNQNNLLFYNRVSENAKPLNILIFGDSITDSASITIENNKTTTYNLDYNLNENRWVQLLTYYFNTFDVRNYAKSGASYRDRDRAEGLERQNVSYQIEVAFNDLLNENNAFPTVGNYNPDIIIFALGTNDTLSTLGSVEDSLNKSVWAEKGILDVNSTLNALDRTILCDAIRYAYLKVRAKFPYAQIFTVLPLQTAEKNWITDDYKKIRDNIITFANLYNIIIIDGGHSIGIVGELEKNNHIFLSDGLHPNAQGRNLYAKMVINAIKQNWIDDIYMNGNFMN